MKIEAMLGTGIGRRQFQDLTHQAQVFEFIYRSVVSQFEHYRIPAGELTKIATTIYINHAKK